MNCLKPSPGLSAVIGDLIEKQKATDDATDLQNEGVQRQNCQPGEEARGHHRNRMAPKRQDRFVGERAVLHDEREESLVADVDNLKWELQIVCAGP